MVPADSRRIPRVPRYSGARSPRLRVSPRGLSPSAARLSSRFGYAAPLASARVLQPRRRLDAGGLGSCAFARHYLRNHCYFLFLRVLRCFSSPRSPPRVARMTGSLPPGFPIRTSPGRCAFAAHRRFSQLVTSFVASESHRHPPCALRNFPCSSFRSLRHASAPHKGNGARRSILSVYSVYFRRLLFRHSGGGRRGRPVRPGAVKCLRSQHVNDLSTWRITDSNR